jgi:hypothetical protein
VTETVKFVAIDLDKSISAEELITRLVDNQLALAKDNEMLGAQFKTLLSEVRRLAALIAKPEPPQGGQIH